LDEFRLSSERRGGYTVVAVRGNLDIVTRDQFDNYLTGIRREHDRIIIDMSAVGFMDTSSLAIVVGHWKKLSAAGGVLILAGARYRYAKTLWITGLAYRLPLYDSVEEAMAADPPQPRGERNVTRAERPRRTRPPGRKGPALPGKSDEPEQ